MALALLLTAYMVVAVIYTRRDAAASRLAGVEYCVADSAATGFVDAREVDRVLGNLSRRIIGMRRDRFNSLAIERQLNAMDKIERATCVILANGQVRITVVPMQPVARVFDGNSSYYINSEGKRITADARFNVDVPVVYGHFSSGLRVVELLPMFAYIKSQPEYDALVTGVDKAPNGDIMLIPAVAGHVINFGDTSRVADKFARLRSFYHEVMPYKGWDYYDTLSVKWRGRLVATRRTKKQIDNRPLTELDGIVDEVPDNGTMLTVTIDSLQSKP